MSADGNVVAYTSRATNLVDGLLDGNGPEARTPTHGSSAARPSATRSTHGPARRPTPMRSTGRAHRPGRVGCDDEGPSGLKSCEGTVPAGQPIDTSDTGEFTFKVTATDNAGNTNDRHGPPTGSRRRTRSSRSPAGRPAAAPKRSRPATPAAPARSFSADGRYLVFTSQGHRPWADFINGNNGAESDVYRRDLQTGITEVVSAGLPRPADAGRPRGANDAADTSINAAPSAPTVATCCSPPTPPT